MKNKENMLLSRSYGFAIDIVRSFQYLNQTAKEYVLSKQLLRSGTAVGSLIREAQNAESKPDFIHKLGIAQKECAETGYWLTLLNETNYLPEDQFEHLNKECESLL